MFSILIPVRNSAIFLKECLYSVRSQTFKEYEVIIIDNGSTDGSRRICEDYCKKDFRFHYYYQENKGILNSRRKAISLSKEEYLIFIDSDDYVDKNLLSILFSKINDTNADVIVYSHYILKNDNLIKAKRILKKSFLNSKADIIDAFFDGKMNNMWCKCVRNTCIEKDNKYLDYANILFSEDRLQSIDIFKNCNSIAYIDSPLYFYRIHSSNTSSNFNRPRVDEFFILSSIIYNKLFNLCSKKGRNKCINNFKRVVTSFINSFQSGSTSYSESKENMMYLRNLCDRNILYLHSAKNHIGVKYDIIFFLFIHKQDKLLYKILGNKYEK